MQNRRVQGLGANQLAGLLEWWDGRRKVDHRGGVWTALPSF